MKPRAEDPTTKTTRRLMRVIFWLVLLVVCRAIWLAAKHQ